MQTLLRILWIAVFVSLSSGQAVGEQPTLVRLSFTSGWDALPAIVAMERGFFHGENLVVSGMASSSPTAVMNSIAAGSTDFAAVPQRTLLVMAAANLPIKVVGKNGWGTEMELVTAADNTTISSIEDLKGKVVAIGPASEAYPVFVRLLNSAGLRPSDLNIRFLEADNLVAVFESGLVDAMFETRYYTSAVVSSGQARVVLPNKDISDVLGTIGALPLVANAKLVKDDPQTVQKFMNAWVKALIYIQQDPADAAHLVRFFFHRQGTPVPEKLARAWVSFTRYDRYTWSNDDILDAEYNGWGLVEGRILKASPKLSGFIDNTFATKAWDALQTQ